jgi:hypothetical protein
MWSLLLQVTVDVVPSWEPQSTPGSIGEESGGGRREGRTKERGRGRLLEVSRKTERKGCKERDSK